MQSKPSHGPGPRANHLLAALPEGVWSRWIPHLRSVELRRGGEVGHAGTGPHYAVFPTTAVVSLVCMTHEGATSEICVVGREGAVGLSLCRGGAGSPGMPIVQTSGVAYRLDARLLTEECQRGGPVLDMVLRYGQSVLAQVAQTALCNRHHSIEQQVCRRLLQELDRSPSSELRMTQSGIALGLGVRREGVSGAALRLQRDGIIRYRRGRITVLNRRELERRACGCYRAAKQEQDRLFPRAELPDSPDSALQPVRRRVRDVALIPNGPVQPDARARA